MPKQSHDLRGFALFPKAENMYSGMDTSLSVAPDGGFSLYLGMVIEYTLEPEDYLAFQLLFASKSDRIRKKRFRAKVVAPVLYIALGLAVWFYEENPPLGISFIIGSFLWYFLYPKWEKRYYFKHFQAFVNENMKAMFGRPVLLMVTDEHILTKDNGNESKITTSEITEINEIPAIIAIRLQGGQGIVLPKKRMDNIAEVRTYLQHLAEKLNVQYTIEDNWVWK